MFQAKEFSFTVTFIRNTLYMKIIKKQFANNNIQSCIGKDRLKIG